MNLLTPIRGEKRLRLYDAGLHHGTHAPGERVRIEAVRWWRKREQRAPEAFSALQLRDIYLRRRRPWLNSAPSFMILRPSDAKRTLEVCIASGGIKQALGLRLIGFLDALERGTAPQLLKRRDRTRYLGELRRLGVSPDVGVRSQEQVVDLLPLLRAIDDRWNKLVAAEQTA